mgnify:FL=1
MVKTVLTERMALTARTVKTVLTEKMVPMARTVKTEPMVRQVSLPMNFG